MGKERGPSRSLSDAPRSAAEVAGQAIFPEPMGRHRQTLENLRRVLGVDREAEPEWPQLLAAIREIPEILTTISYDIPLPRDGVRPEEMAVSTGKLLKELQARTDDPAAAAHAILRLVEVGCLEPRQLEVPFALPEELMQPVVQVFQKLHPTAEVPSGVLRFPVSCVRPTPLLADWQKLVKPPEILEADEWPLRNGWSPFQPGEAAYNGQRFPISGKHREVLERFVRAKGTALTIAVLRTDVWDGDRLIDDNTIRSAVSDVRNILRGALGLSKSKADNPILSVDRQAYRLVLK